MNTQNILFGVLIEAAQDKLIKLDGELAEVELEEERARSVHDGVLAKRNLVNNKRAALLNYLRDLGLSDEQKALDFVRAEQQSGESGTSGGRVTSARIVQEIKDMLKGGERMKVKDLHAELLRRGVDIRPPRISQVLSLNPSFQPDRLEGWYMIDPANAGETESSR